MNLKIFLTILLLISATVSFAQKKSKLKAPPGTVQINDTLFADKTEIANVHYREYLWWLVKYDSLKYERMLPDTSVWGVDTTDYHYDSVNNIKTTTFSNSPMMEYYFRHPGFNDYPVVGISYEQAVEFCKWRSDRVNELIESKPFSERPFKMVSYRLPTQQEWEILAAGKLSIDKNPYGNDSVYTKWKKKYWKAFNCKYPLDKAPDSFGKERAFYTADVKSFFPNSYHLYNMIGNVAEIVSEEGIAKGGSFNHKLEDCKIISNQYYTKPERWLGFRCVAVIIKYSP